MAGLTLLALALRLPHLGESLVGDEMYATREVHGRSLTGVIDAVRQGGENSPPLFFVLAWVSMKLGDPTVTIRLPSLVLGTATVPLVYLVGRRTVSGRAAWWPRRCRHGAPSRSSTPPRRGPTRRSRSSWSVHAGAADGPRFRPHRLVGRLRRERVRPGLYAHYFGLFVLLAQGLWVLWAHRDRWRPLVIAGAAIAGDPPWVIAFLGQKGEQHLDPRVLCAAERRRHRAGAAAAGSRASELRGLRAAGEGGGGRAGPGAGRGARGGGPQRLHARLVVAAPQSPPGARGRAGGGSGPGLPALQRSRPRALHRPLPQRRPAVRGAARRRGADLAGAGRVARAHHGRGGVHGRGGGGRP